jgi:hypothetical protein
MSKADLARVARKLSSESRRLEAKNERLLREWFKLTVENERAKDELAWLKTRSPRA